LRRLGVAALIAVSLTACVETITKHGHQFHEGDLTQISPGMSQEQVKTALGSPTTTAAVGSGSAYYYISSTQGQTLFLSPKEKDRRVVAVYFGQMGSVDRVAPAHATRSIAAGHSVLALHVSLAACAPPARVPHEPGHRRPVARTCRAAE
jgi:outer membrane protein assembly factor BamE (lipoprotein component of BamABCDE complex)